MGLTRRRATLSCILLECVTARLFLISVGSLAYLCQSLPGMSVFCLRGRMLCWRWFGWRRMSIFRLSYLRCTLVRRQGARGHTPRWMLYGGRLVTNRIIRHLSSTAKHFFSLAVSSTGARSPAPSGPRPADHGRGQGRMPSQSLSWQTGSRHDPTVMPIDDSSDPWLNHTSNCWPLEEHHYDEGFAVNASFKTDDPPLWRDLLSPRADVLRENQGFASTATKTTIPSSIVGILLLL